MAAFPASHQLRKLDPTLQVTLHESGSRLGGVIQTTEKDGFLIEGAADNFITTSPTAIELCKDLGLADELVRTNPGGGGAMVVSRGKLEPIPPGFMVMAPSRLWPILATKILSPLGKLRSGMEVFVPRKKDQTDESLHSFITRRFGTEMFERLVQPLVGGIYTADPTRLSVAATMPRFMDMERDHGSLIRGMMAGRRKQKHSDERRGGAMLHVEDTRLTRRLKSIQYARCAVVSLAFRRDQIKAVIDSFGFVVPHIENHFILSCSFSSEKYEGRAPADTVLMRVFIGGALQPGLLRLPDQQLIELAHWELAKLLDIQGEPILRHITRQTHAMPQYHVGHKQRIAEIHERLEQYPTLALAGSSLTGVGVPGCIENGQKAAARVIAGLNERKVENLEVKNVECEC